MLARLDLPLLIGETDAFKDYIKTAHNPAFAPVSKQLLVEICLSTSMVNVKN
jgi:hypothetical protein